MATYSFARYASPWSLIGVILTMLATSVVLGADKPDPAMQPIKDDPRLPRVLLIGDSISIGYTLDVRSRLTGVANVHRIPDNSQTTAYVLKRLDAWLRGEKGGEEATGGGKAETGAAKPAAAKWDVIHFNIGLHDVKDVNGQRQVSPDDYEKNLKSIVGRLKATGATLIWASTTPIPEGAARRTPGDEIAYNTIAARVMTAEKVTTNDLFAVAQANQHAWQRKADVHFTAKGYAGLAEPVAIAITEALKTRT